MTEETYESLGALIPQLEAEAESLNKNIVSIEKKLGEIDYQILSIIKTCTVEPALINSYARRAKQLQEEENKEFEKYIELRKTQEVKIFDLREKYAKFIKLYHKKKQQERGQSIKPVEISTSQLLTGTMVYTDDDDITVFRTSSCWIPDSDIKLGTRPDQFMFAGQRDKALLGTSEATEVYSGVCRGKQVAVKVLNKKKLDAEALEAFRKECEVLKSIVGHPNLLLFMGACLEEGKYKIVMELAKHGSLQSAIEVQKQIFSMKRKITMMSEICGGMNWIHRQEPPVLHLNLKPSNLLLANNWVIKISDYGNGDNARKNNTNYSSPELLKKGAGDITS